MIGCVVQEGDESVGEEVLPLPSSLVARVVTVTETVHVSTETIPATGDLVQGEVTAHGARGRVLPPVPTRSS